MLRWYWMAATAVVGIAPLLLVVEANNSDRFNYHGTNTSQGFNDYGPVDWSQVSCSNVDQCMGWPDKWRIAIFPFIGNNCLWCPETGNSCGLHRQSPVALDRHLGVPGDPIQHKCIDTHWMKYEDGACSWEDLVKNNAFTIERHALKVTQPLIGSKADHNVALNCQNPQGLRNFGRMSMSRDGFSYWYLSHIDFHVPSEHTQNGKRYSAEAHLYHFLPPPPSNRSGENLARHQAFAPTILFEAYEDAEPYGFLDKLICQWRLAEDARRAECGMPSITTSYPGCFSKHRGSNSSSTTARRDKEHRQLRSSPGTVNHQDEPIDNKAERKPFSALDVSLGNAFVPQNGHGVKHQPAKLEMDPSNFRPPDDVDWDEFIQSQYENEKEQQGRRQLTNYDNVGPWHNYFLMLGVKTEYYFRYQGSLTFPPCFGPYTPDTKTNSTHFRVLKDPIRVHPRQIAEMERLLAHRIAPTDDPNLSCQPDTAGAFVNGSPDRVNVARPLQSLTSAHYAMFCDCQEWVSHWKEDQAWCKMDLETRFFKRPYNFMTDGF